MSKILVVEDSRTQAEQLRYVLEDAGYEATIAADASEAVSLFSKDAFDVVISDIVMPGQTGYDLCRTLKADRDGRATPFILLSSLSDPMDIIRGLECGADNFLTKPYEPELLLARVATAIQNRRLRHENKVKLGIDVWFLGRPFTITSDKEQILDLLVSTFEDIVRTNFTLRESKAQLAEAKAQIEMYARRLEDQVKERTAELANANRLLEGEVADRTRMAQSLQESNALLTAIITSSPLPIYVLDLEGKVTLWNSAAAKVFGTRPVDAIGKLPPFVRSEKVKEFLGSLVKVDTPFGVSGVPFNGQLRGGNEIELSISAAPVLDGQSQKRGTMHVAMDVTEQKALERKLSQSQKMEAVGQLTGGIAHDFNNLLSVVIGNLDLVQEEVGGSQKAEEMIEAALQACLRGASLTHQLLVFSRHQALQSSLIDLNNAVIGTTNLLSRVLGERIETKLVTSPTPCMAKTDPSQVEAALMNLAVNASHAMPDGGLLTIETKHAHLDQDYVAANPDAKAGHYVVLEVTDTGTGIPPEILDRVFEPFFTTKPEGKGTGLGLSQVFGFLKQSSGHMKIYSEVGAGTTVRLYFPTAARDTASDVSEVKDDNGAMHKGCETILVVEDNEHVRKMLVTSLATLGYSVLEASSGDVAAQIIDSGQEVDLLFTDVVMPGRLNGVDLVSYATQRRPGLRALVSSGFPGTAISRKSTLPPSVQVLNKPYRHRELAQKIKEILGSN